MDYYERALYNHILSSQHPAHGGFVYFTPDRPRHYRVYSTADECFWCCVGTGMENHAQVRPVRSTRTATTTLFVNLFMASELKWPERGLTVRQDTTFPDEGRYAASMLALAQPVRLTLHVRHPGWAPRMASA